MNELIGQGVGAIIGTGMDIMSENRAQARYRRNQDAQNQHEASMMQRQYDLNMKQWEETNYKAQIEQMRKAGLNPALMYKSAGQGGTTGNISSSPRQAPNLPSYNSGAQMAIEMGMAQSQIELNRSQAEKNKAEAENISERTTTEINTRDILVENMKQSGIETWFRNVKQEYIAKGGWSQADDEVNIYKNVVYGSETAYTRDSWEIKQLNEDLLKTVAEKDQAIANKLLTDKKIQHYWDELMNATAHANADMIRAYAEKLSKEWTTGEYTNWKTWAELSMNAIKTAGGLIKDVKSVPTKKPVK